MLPPRTDHRSTRLLVLLNPGRTSRHYLLGIAGAARQRGILAGTLELGEVWAAAGSPASRAKVAARVRGLCEEAGVTHVLGYVHNGVFDFGLHEAGNGPEPLFASMGLRHILLWTDHPNWAQQGGALDPRAAKVLAHPLHTHIVKSQAAAAEIAEVLGWPAVMGMPMAEDPGMIVPDRSIMPVHDAVMIVGDPTAPPIETLSFLDDADPEPAAVMRAMRPAAERAFELTLGSWSASAEQSAGLWALARSWLDAKEAQPLRSFHGLARGLEASHGPALAALRADPRRWYATIAALGAVSAWRRTFWPAWLARRADLCVMGPGAGGPWVEYQRQASAYALGCCAININAPHDEEGLTHKPFQIVASGVPLVHHATIGLDDCFTAGDEVLVFERGGELLEALRRAGRALERRATFADAARQRLLREHTWDHRLQQMIARANDSAALDAAPCDNHAHAPTHAARADEEPERQPIG